jgi:hypothetical protein
MCLEVAAATTGNPSTDEHRVLARLCRIFPIRHEYTQAEVVRPMMSDNHELRESAGQPHKIRKANR